MGRGISLLLVLTSLAIPACASDRPLPGTGAAEPAMKGTVYEAGRVFAQTYCSPCHWKGGQHPRRVAAYPAFQVDTYEQWATGRTIIPAVLDKWNPDGKVMPPPEAPEFPSDDDRRLILGWVRAGSPNTISGN
jgi:hypothetical protein